VVPHHISDRDLDADLTSVDAFPAPGLPPLIHAHPPLHLLSLSGCFPRFSRLVLSYVISNQCIVAHARTLAIVLYLARRAKEPQIWASSWVSFGGRDEMSDPTSMSAPLTFQAGIYANFCGQHPDRS
jgi:hypothetical protein